MQRALELIIYIDLLLLLSCLLTGRSTITMDSIQSIAKTLSLLYFIDLHCGSWNTIGFVLVISISRKLDLLKETKEYSKLDSNNFLLSCLLSIYW